MRSPFDRKTPLGLFRGRNLRTISATVNPSLGALAVGDQVQDGLSTGALLTSNYASTAGTISTVTAAVTVNGSAGALTDVVAALDVVSVSITVTDSEANERVYYAGAQTVPGVAPSISGVPTIAGTTQEGETLTATAASVTGTAPITRTWQWERTGAAISGATGATYVLQAADIGHTLTVVQTETSDYGSDTAESIATAEITAPDNTAPVINTFTYDDATQAATVNITEGSGSSTVVWATSDTGVTPTYTRAGGWAGGANYETGSYTATSGGDTDVVSITATTPDGSRKLTIYAYDAADNLSAPASVTITVDTTAPTVSTLSPADNATDVAVDANLVMTFSESMARQGTVTLKTVGGATIQTFDLSTDGTWSTVSATDDRITLNPTADLSNSAEIAVQWSGLEDTYGNALANNATDTTWNFTVVAAASSVNFVEFGSGADLFDMNADTAAVATTSSAFTYAVKYRYLASTASQITYVAAGGNLYSWIRFAASGAGLRIDLHDSANANQYFEIETFSPAISAGDEIAILWEATATTSTIRYAINGGSVVTVDKTYTDSGNDLRVPYMINSTNGTTPLQGIGVGGVWLSLAGGSGATWSDFFDASNDPTTAMANGSTINSLAPAFSESGNAAAWNALTGMTGTVSDL